MKHFKDQDELRENNNSQRNPRVILSSSQLTSCTRASQQDQQGSAHPNTLDGVKQYIAVQHWLHKSVRIFGKPYSFCSLSPDLI